MLTVAERAGNPAWQSAAHRALADTLLFMGEFVRAREQAARCVKSLEASAATAAVRTVIGASDPKTASISILCWPLMVLGYADQARQRNREAADLAPRHTSPSSLLLPTAIGAILCRFLRDANGALESARRAFAIASERGIPGMMASMASVRGWALAEQGQLEVGIAETRRALEAYKAAATTPRTLDLVPLAEVYGRAGQPKRGLALLARATEHIQSTGERFLEADIYRVKGELLLMREASAGEAEDCFRQAIEIARRQRAKWFELRATTSLARLLRDTGRRDEARSMLAEIYGWFTEGFDTSDLKDAKALLEELSA
jgi:adenylate cyclase